MPAAGNRPSDRRHGSTRTASTTIVASAIPRRSRADAPERLYRMAKEGRLGRKGNAGFLEYGG